MKRYIRALHYYDRWDDESRQNSASAVYDEYVEQINYETDCKKIGDIVDKALDDKRLWRLHGYYKDCIYQLGVKRCNELRK